MKIKNYFDREEVDRIKAENLISLYAQGIVKKLKRSQSGSYTGLCPFHNDKHPSFGISPNGTSFKCFSCFATGDVISFVQKIYGFDFVQACEFLDREGTSQC